MMGADGSRQIHNRANLIRTPPFSIEAEISVLGGLLLDNSNWHAAAAKLRAEDFYRADHQVIWAGIGDVIRAGKACDFVTLVEHFRDRKTLEEAGGLAYLASLAQNTPSSANVEAYADVVRERSMLRRLIGIGGDIAEMGYSPDGEAVDVLIGHAMEKITAILRDRGSSSLRFLQVVEKAQATADTMRRERAAGRDLGAMTGIRRLDQLTGGFRGPRLVVIAARPKCGKSALLNQYGIFAAKHGSAGYINTIELQDEELGFRGMAMLSGANVTALHRGNQKAHDDASDAIVGLGDIPLWIDDRNRTLEGFCAQVAYHKHRYGITWAAVDHIGLMRTQKRYASRNDQMGEISWTLKELAKSLGIPIIALSQLSRQCDKENRRPRPDDLRDSGNIEQDADVVIMMHTPQGQRDADERPLWIGVPANRTGPACWLRGAGEEAPFRFIGATQSIVEADASE